MLDIDQHGNLFQNVDARGRFVPLTERELDYLALANIVAVMRAQMRAEQGYWPVGHPETDEDARRLTDAIASVISELEARAKALKASVVSPSGIRED